MTRVLVVRLGQAIAVIGIVVTLCFALVRLAPGDPFFAALDQPGVPPEAAAAMRVSFGYDRPLHEQYLRFLRNIASGDLGYSHSRSRPVREVIAALLPNSLLLSGTGLLVGALLGIGLGAWQGWRAESRLATLSDRALLAIASVPEFVLALLLAMLFALELRWLPVSGMRSEGVGGAADVLRHLILPAGTLALMVAAILARHQRAAMRGVRNAEFIRAARASGIPERRVLFRHALRNAIAPVLTVLGVMLGAVAGGTVLIERVFDWPGMGRAVVEAVGQRDYPLVVGAVLVTSVAVTLATLLADLAVAWADPRLRNRL
ncbi:ABC transporter permease [Pseudogemmatithrix spongiicola]|uniref:ABC transporter permease n=1 Tax=Pseudogemmatithrix spongiicola TaxID=3062599 RepID=A0AA49JSR1_9BACT|nr:ABC transporter permease [Gemmatimonadaceae bacterium 'strain 138']WKW14212.1 ABC transporter permease [Gemmatimonadaceae bacterium 'strain 318']